MRQPARDGNSGALVFPLTEKTLERQVMELRAEVQMLRAEVDTLKTKPARRK